MIVCAAVIATSAVHSSSFCASQSFTANWSGVLICIVAAWTILITWKKLTQYFKLCCFDPVWLVNTLLHLTYPFKKSTFFTTRSNPRKAYQVLIKSWLHCSRATKTPCVARLGVFKADVHMCWCCCLCLVVLNTDFSQYYNIHSWCIKTTGLKSWAQIHLASKSDADIRCLLRSWAQSQLYALTSI